ncbi:hypothetical protein MF628_004931 [Paenibacillus polymyxa]|uniref:hypothetical protein n=1 Tax=Paenibacillus polymyxa TaxID=1406 RepID=UPI002023DFCA|nr:hypothetical protein [Paenibacillus polymyxa]URJ45149.1 hypothetical protein MF628_004931 [Paenibacillus polymyxa]
MAKKRITQREIGFIQGIVYAAALQADWGADAYDIISESNFKVEDIRKYAEDCDLQKLENVLERIED